MTLYSVRERFVLTERIADIQDRAARRGSDPPPSSRMSNQTWAFDELYKDLPLRERQARSLAYALVNEPVRVFPGERINGIFYCPRKVGQKAEDPQRAQAEDVAERRALAEVPELADLYGNPANGDTFILREGAWGGHTGWNYDLILSLGVEGLIARHRQAAQATDDAQAREYYNGVILCLEAVLEWNRRHVAAMKRLLEEAATPDERALIQQNIAILERVPARPARTFHEALQSFYFQWLCVMFEGPYGGKSPGRLDYFLWPYLKDEYESDQLSYQDAAELVAELFIKMDERVHTDDQHGNMIIVGGIAPDGTDAVNPLSIMIVDVNEKLDLTHPSVYTRISEVNPPEYVDRCVAYLLNGNNKAQILVDEPIIRAMTREGRMPFEDAAMYMTGGCMEILPQGMNSDLLFAFQYNVPKTLELLVTGGECLVTGRQRLAMPYSLRDFADFESFYQALEQEMQRVLWAKFHCLDIYSEEMARWRPTFLLSSMIADCLERGRSQQDGGARYADYGGAPLGIQNAADSVYAVKKAVFDERFCSADELVEALRANFEGHERLHRRLLALPKYGMGDAEADGMMSRLLVSICDIYDSYTNRHGRRVKPIILTFIWAVEMGRSLGASPDGRKAGQPIAHGLTPQSMSMRKGITAAMNSYTSLPNEHVSGGATTLWDMDPDWIDHELLRSILTTFIGQGGQIFHGNMTSVAELRRAMENPEAYPSLTVRVGGYSARFINLDRELQEEIIARRRHRG